MTTRITLWRELFAEHPQSWTSGYSALDGADDLGCSV